MQRLIITIYLYMYVFYKLTRDVIIYSNAAKKNLNNIKINPTKSNQTSENN